MNDLTNIIWSPSEYAEAAFLAKVAGEEMLSRFDWMTIKPEVIIDLGCGVADSSRQLQRRYPAATVYSIDVSDAMLSYAQEIHPDGIYIRANATSLPLRDQSVDIVFANFVLSWQSDFKVFLAECKRVLRPEGLLMVNAIGPDTLSEWRVDMRNEEIPCFMDMHDLGDLLLQTGFSDPVVDVNDYTATYQDKSKFVRELKASGFWNPASPTAELPSLAAAPTVEWYAEICFAHAFAPAPTNEVPMSDGEARVPLSHLRQQLRGGRGL